MQFGPLFFEWLVHRKLLKTPLFHTQTSTKQALDFQAQGGVTIGDAPVYFSWNGPKVDRRNRQKGESMNETKALTKRSHVGPKATAKR